MLRLSGDSQQVCTYRLVQTTNAELDNMTAFSIRMPTVPVLEKIIINDI